MSSDMMLVCREDHNYYGGKDETITKKESAVFIDECSMGDPWHDFGKWFQERFCKGPSMMDQMMGKQTHNWMELTAEDVSSVKEAITHRKAHKGMNKNKLIKYMESHIGKGISTENW